MRKGILGLILAVAWPFGANAQFTQQGAKLVGAGALGKATLGSSIALSGDGNTALIGGPADNNRNGAVWLFVRSGGVWTQQDKLVASDALDGASVVLQ